ncbi:growth-regulating factor 7-like [Olea europaea var. sylvestris]|uniref:growth-regulating factor 7-like n=1 Tax=Olea europaea var. sylvestris TaxID=158386 RepID=UPI000C1D16F4|nr:growth-regulating factor 7-like [Olea europaea var. sylvestris]
MNAELLHAMEDLVFKLISTKRQAMIYNYMMASMPMPPDLPFHAPSNLSISLFECSDWSSRKVQAMDGKKWRCSRDVPHHKYYERHLQKSRSCSRKPVEIKNNATNNNEKKSPLLFNPKIDLSISTSSSKKI